MFGKILTEENKELLKIIYEYGGYIRVSHLDLLYPNLSYISKFNKLDKLKSMRYLTARRFKTDSKREPVTYQVTKSACRLFDNPDSHYRKKHQVEYAYRALVKNYFCLELCRSNLKDNILSNHDDRVKFLKDNNFKEEFFPRKYNKNESFIHIEEFIIDLTKNENKMIYKDDLIYDDKIKRAVIVYIDKYYVPVKKQISTLVNKYVDMITNGGNCHVDFLVVVDDVNRKNLYDKEIEKFLVKNVFRDKISDSIVKLYFNYLEKYYEAVGDQSSLVKLITDYRSGNLKAELLDKYANIKLNDFNDYLNDLRNNILLKGQVYVIEKVKSLIVSAGSIDNSLDKVMHMFKNIFILEANNFISFSDGARKKKFDIKTYKIDIKIYE